MATADYRVSPNINGERKYTPLPALAEFTSQRVKNERGGGETLGLQRMGREHGML